MEQPAKNTFPVQHQSRQLGREAEMNPAPVYDTPGYYQAGGELTDKRAAITGGDSGAIVNWREERP